MNRITANILPKGLFRFFLIIIITIGVTYLQDSRLTSVWCVVLLIMYARSDDEPFWLAFFLVTVDGFMSFLGLYSVTIKLIAGLPAIEVAQFYILISLFKAIRKKRGGNVFYLKYLQILFLYLIFLIIWGFVLGFSGNINDYFRIFKSALPLILFYSLPGLFTKPDNYERFFHFIFLVLILGFVTQIFTLISGISLNQIIDWSDGEIEEGKYFRTFYNTASALLGLLGSLIYLTTKRRTFQTSIYLYLVVLSAYGMAFMSATRGWILSFSFIIVGIFLLVEKFNFIRVVEFLVLASIFIFIGFTNNRIKAQVNYAKERVFTLRTIASGDLSAGGTLQRIEDRSPRVMKKWAERPIFGWGNSDTAREYFDGHVGNQNLLMTTGVVGFALVVGFFLYFSYKLYLIYRKRNRYFCFRSAIAVIIIFLAGWFIIHSTSGQQFGYGGSPVQIMPQAIFFSLGALLYNKYYKESHVRTF